MYLTTEHPYKDARSNDRAVDLLKEEAGQHFDPALVHAFLQSWPEVLEIKERYAESVGLTFTEMHNIS